MKKFKEYLQESKIPNGWEITNVDAKRNLKTYTNTDNTISVTFGKDGWTSANPTKEYDNIDSYVGKKYDILSVLKKYTK